jgi:hypothetical protein
VSRRKSISPKASTFLVEEHLDMYYEHNNDTETTSTHQKIVVKGLSTNERLNMTMLLPMRNEEENNENDPSLTLQPYNRPDISIEEDESGNTISFVTAESEEEEVEEDWTEEEFDP